MRALLWLALWAGTAGGVELGWEASQFCLAASQLCGALPESSFPSAAHRVLPPSAPPLPPVTQPSTTTTTTPTTTPAASTTTQGRVPTMSVGSSLLEDEAGRLLGPFPRRRNASLRRSSTQRRRMETLRRHMEDKLLMKKHLLKAFAKKQGLEKLGKGPGEEEEWGTTLVPVETLRPTVEEGEYNGCWRRVGRDRVVQASRVESVSYARGLSLSEALLRCEAAPECNALRFQPSAGFAHFLRLHRHPPLMDLLVAYPHQQAWLFLC